MKSQSLRAGLQWIYNNSAADFLSEDRKNWRFKDVTPDDIDKALNWLARLAFNTEE